MNLSKIHHIAIIVSDYETAKDFYVNKLGFSVIRENYRPERKDWKLDLRVNEHTELEIVAVCDIDPEKLEKTAAQLDHVHPYTDYKTMLKEETPDLVAIATESGKHAQLALDCIRAGCHVIIENPIALSIADADQIIEMAKQKGVLVCVNHQNRFNKSIQYIHGAIAQGRFGRLLHGSARIFWNRKQDYYEQAPWRGTWEQDGGALMNQCIHNIDLLCWLMGSEAVEVFACETL